MGRVRLKSQLENWQGMLKAHYLFIALKKKFAASIKNLGFATIIILFDKRCNPQISSGHSSLLKVCG